jgi:hypothetical protein
MTIEHGVQQLRETLFCLLTTPTHGKPGSRKLKKKGYYKETPNDFLQAVIHSLSMSQHHSKRIAFFFLTSKKREHLDYFFDFGPSKFSQALCLNTSKIQHLFRLLNKSSKPEKFSNPETFPEDP